MQLSRTFRVFAAGKRSGSFQTKLLLAWSLLVCAMPGPAVQAGQTDYRLVAGDVIEISAANAPDLRQRVPVQLDGTISLPLVGTIPAEGLPFSEIRNRIQLALASRVARVRTPDGRELSRMLDRDEISVAVVEYKPIFVMGEVSRPGEQVFRPRMTVRQAVASAGGSLSQAARAAGNAFDGLSLQSDFMTASISIASEQARIWRIQKELGTKQEFDWQNVPPAVSQDGTVTAILEIDKSFSAGRESDQSCNREFLQRSIKQMDEQIDILTEQQKKEELGLQEDTQELQRTTELYNKGTVPITRVTDARRAVLLSSTRRLQTAAQLMQVRRNRAEFSRDVEKADDQRRIELLTELREATVKLAGERARLEKIQEKIVVAGAAIPTGQDRPSAIELIVHRRTGSTLEELNATFDMELQPGDVIEVAMRQQEQGESRPGASAGAPPRGLAMQQLVPQN